MTIGHIQGIRNDPVWKPSLDGMAGNVTVGISGHINALVRGTRQQPTTLLAQACAGAIDQDASLLTTVPPATLMIIGAYADRCDLVDHGSDGIQHCPASTVSARRDLDLQLVEVASALLTAGRKPLPLSPAGAHAAQQMRALIGDRVIDAYDMPTGTTSNADLAWAAGRIYRGKDADMTFIRAMSARLPMDARMAFAAGVLTRPDGGGRTSPWVHGMADILLTTCGDTPSSDDLLAAIVAGAANGHASAVSWIGKYLGDGHSTPIHEATPEQRWARLPLMKTLTPELCDLCWCDLSATDSSPSLLSIPVVRQHGAALLAHLSTMKHIAFPRRRSNEQSIIRPAIMALQRRVLPTGNVQCDLRLMRHIYALSSCLHRGVLSAIPTATMAQWAERHLHAERKSLADRTGPPSSDLFMAMITETYARHNDGASLQIVQPLQDVMAIWGQSRRSIDYVYRHSVMGWIFTRPTGTMDTACALYRIASDQQRYVARNKGDTSDIAATMTEIQDVAKRQGYTVD
jgi:hypothetical protein